MPRFSRASLDALKSCDPRLQLVLNTAIKYIDFSVLEGHRGKAAQDEAYRTGKSKVRYPNGKHNKVPSLAVDIAPWPGPGKEIDWADTERFVYFAGFIMGLAAGFVVRLRWGGDWDRDTEVEDETFRDLGHFELVD